MTFVAGSSGPPLLIMLRLSALTAFVLPLLLAGGLCVSGSPASPSQHWAFQPVAEPQIPPVADQSWPLNPIDHFIQAKREAAGLRPAPDAPPAVLHRRLHYALTGLPPVDFSPATLEQGSEQLLATPQYGERWGRHWLDWVRYADTAGDNSDFPIPQAYLYRNYVIQSLNADIPYDRFLTEQLAGDLLPSANQEERNRLTIATGYVAMARRFGSLVETYPQHLTIEDTIDNMSRTMLGLTISCARCHDHKTDPVSTADYYGLYGIFASTRYPFPGIELFQVQRDLVPLVPEDEARKHVAPFENDTRRLTDELERLLAEGQTLAVTTAEKIRKAPPEEARELKGSLGRVLGQTRKAGEALAAHLKKIPTLPAAYAVRDAQPANARIQLKGEPDNPGVEVPRKFPDILGGYTLPAEAQQTSGRLQLAQWITDAKNPLTARVIVNRVWQRHFGTGLVASTSDFGARGERPTHPELLDWLAADFMRHGWSLKHLHRRILASRTWRMASSGPGEQNAQDPANKLYWRFNRQRLDAESIRDTLLVHSARLDAAPQTEPYPIPPQRKWEYTQHYPFKDDYPSLKRSVYQMTRRLTVLPYMQNFDGADPNVCTSVRGTSVTPLQALYFVNDSFVHEQAEAFGKRIAALPGDDETRLARAFRLVLARDPDPQEQALWIAHLMKVQETQPPAVAWASAGRTLFQLNEFLYLD